MFFVFGGTGVRTHNLMTSHLPADAYVSELNPQTRLLNKVFGIFFASLGIEFSAPAMSYIPSSLFLFWVLLGCPDWAWTLPQFPRVLLVQVCATTADALGILMYHIIKPPYRFYFMTLKEVNIYHLLTFHILLLKLITFLFIRTWTGDRSWRSVKAQDWAWAGRWSRCQGETSANIRLY